MLKKVRKNDKGFTLVELIVVVAIMAVLAALLIPRIAGNTKEAKKQSEITQAQTIASELTIWNAQAESDDDNNTSAVVGDGSTALTEAQLPSALALPSGTKFPTGTYANIVVDTKGNASVVTVP